MPHPDKREASHHSRMAPTTLLTHPADGSSRNCLAQAVASARGGQDEIIFLSGLSPAPSIGHVIVRDTRGDTVREPETMAGAGATMELAAYLATSGRRVLATVSVSTLRHVLGMDPARRAQAIAAAGTQLRGIEHLAFGIVGYIPPPVPHKDPPPPTTMPNAQDQAVKDWLDALGGAVSDDDKKSLVSTADDATTLLNWFNAHKRGDPAIDKDMPQNVKDAESRLQQDKSVGARLVDPSDPTTITRDAIGSFVKDLDDAAGSAKDSWNAFIKNNPNADPVSEREAVDASVLQANIPVFDAAGSSGAKVDGLFNKDDLRAVASSGGTQSGDNAHLPSVLANAAAFYLNNSAFDQMEVAGTGWPDSQTDGLANADDLKAVLSNGTRKPEDTIALLQNDALQQAVADAGGDVSKFNSDYFDDPSKSNASGADKAAVLVQLQSTLARYDAGVQTYPDSGFISSDNYYGDGPGATSPGQQRDDFRQKIVDRITTLSKDTDVASFVSAKVPKALQSIVSSDPGLHDAVKSQYDSTITSKALNDAFGAKDDKGNPVSTTDALADFEKLPGMYGQALGISPDDLKGDMEKALNGASPNVISKVKQGYDDITSGKEIDDLTKSGTPQDQAIITSTGNKTVYDMVLDKQTVADGTDKFNDSVSAMGRSNLTDGKSIDDMLKGLGLSGIDDPNLEKFVQDNLNTLTAQGPDQPKASDIVSVLRNVNDTMRGTAKFDDAMKKAMSDWEQKAPGLSSTYKSGVFHGVSALLLGGVLAARVGQNGQGSDPKSVAQTVQQSLQVGGLLAEGGAKYYATTLGDLKTEVKNDQDLVDRLKGLQALPFADPDAVPESLSQAEAQLSDSSGRLSSLETIGKSVENVGKLAGGVVGNALGCVFGAIGAADSAKQGDTGNTVVQSVFAGINGIATIASAGEVASFIAPRIATAIGSTAAEAIGGAAEAIGGAFGAIGGVAGVVGGVLGIAAFVGFGIYALVEAVKTADKVYGSEDNWYKELQDGFAPAGVPLPNELALTDPADGPPPLDVPVGA